MPAFEKTGTAPTKGPSGATEDAMTEAQASALKRLAEQAFEPEAFSQRLTKAESQRRIDALEAKLRLQDEPPHTL